MALSATGSTLRFKDLIALECDRSTGVFDTLRPGATPGGAEIEKGETWTYLKH